MPYFVYPWLKQVTKFRTELGLILCVHSVPEVNEHRSAVGEVNIRMKNIVESLAIFAGARLKLQDKKCKCSFAKISAGLGERLFS